jgi:hypothetical protein
MNEDEPADLPGDDRLDAICAALVNVYGDDAHAVAQQQMDAASGPALANWAAIMRRLRPRS